MSLAHVLRREGTSAFPDNERLPGRILKYESDFLGGPEIFVEGAGICPGDRAPGSEADDAAVAVSPGGPLMDDTGQRSEVCGAVVVALVSRHSS